MMEYSAFMLQSDMYWHYDFISITLLRNIYFDIHVLIHYTCLPQQVETSTETKILSSWFRDQKKKI